MNYAIKAYNVITGDLISAFLMHNVHCTLLDLSFEGKDEIYFQDCTDPPYNKYHSLNNDING